MIKIAITCYGCEKELTDSSVTINWNHRIDRYQIRADPYHDASMEHYCSLQCAARSLLPRSRKILETELTVPGLAEYLKLEDELRHWREVARIATEMLRAMGKQGEVT